MDGEAPASRDGLAAVLKKNLMATAESIVCFQFLVSKMSDASKHHGNAMLISRVNDFLITH